MSTSTILAISFLSAALATLFVRRLWIVAELEKYNLNALYFLHRNKLSVIMADEMSHVWPYSHMLLEVWRWDFSRYVVHQDHLEVMNAFISSELERKDLDLARWEVENAPYTLKNPDETTDKAQPPAPPAP